MRISVAFHGWLPPVSFCLKISPPSAFVDKLADSVIPFTENVLGEPRSEATRNPSFSWGIFAEGFLASLGMTAIKSFSTNSKISASLTPLN